MQPLSGPNWLLSIPNLAPGLQRHAKFVRAGQIFPTAYEVVERVPLEVELQKSFARYLKTKKEKMAHLINVA